MWLALSILVFNIIIIIHETGHFLSAKAFGIKVLEFSLFFGPKIFSFERNGTTYSLRMIPVLAYVKLEGEETDIDSPDSFSNKPLWQRALVIFSGPASNILTALIIYIIIFSISGYATTKISYVADGTPAQTAGIQVGDKLVSYDGRKLYQPLDAYLFMYASKGKQADVEYVRGSEVKKTTVKPTVIVGDRYLIGFYTSDATGKDSNVIKGFTENSPAKTAGIKENDRIVEMNGKKIDKYEDIQNIMQTSKGKALEVVVARTENGKTKRFKYTVTPFHQTEEDQYDLGVGFSGEKGGPLSIVGQSFVMTYDMTRVGVLSIVWLAQGKVPIKDMAGPVGTVAMMNTVASQGTDVAEQLLNLLSIAALVSVGLGVANLLPIPVADGGKLFLYIIEVIRRKPISREAESYINMVGFFLLIVLFIFVMYNDIVRLFSGG